MIMKRTEITKYLTMSFLAFFLATANCQKNEAKGGAMGEEKLKLDRERMVATQIESRGVGNKAVLDAMRKVQRHEFVEKNLWSQAYADYPLPIGEDQTISQPYIVALMTELMELKGGEKVLEIGTGSGYQAAVLAEIAADVFTIEILEPLGRKAEETLKRLGYKNIHVRIGDGYRGWKENAPFDAIIITAAPPKIPEPLKEQLKVGGVMVLPLGVSYQELVVVKKTAQGKFEQKSTIPVRFVPMVGEVQD